MIYNINMDILKTFLQLIGSMGFLMYGMKLMSNGIQKSTGEKLQRVLALMTGNRFIALLVGMIVTMVIQSSGATTVMIVSFVNAGMLTLTQSAGVIFGANIGTTVTAWIVAIFGFDFKVDTFAIPLFGIGFALTTFSKLHKENLGEAIMGFGLLFVGLGMLSSTISPDSQFLILLTKVQNYGTISIILAFLIGVIFTALLHSSSAMAAIILTLAHNKLISWEFSAVMIIGSNIGSTIDAIMASINANANAKRASLIHLIFNIVGATFSLIFLKPLLALVNFIIPGNTMDNIIYNISMLHTLINIFGTIILLPFINQIVAATEKIIKSTQKDKLMTYSLEYTESSKENASAAIIVAEKEISKLTEIATSMFDKIQIASKNRSQKFIDEYFPELEHEEQYADQMQEQLTQFLLHTESLPTTEKQKHNIQLMFQIINSLEYMTDDSYAVGVLLVRSIEKKMSFPQEDMESLIPYLELVRQFLQFINININKHLSKEKLEFAREIENQIDAYRKDLKKVARKRLEAGSDVKSELLYIDLVRNIEKIGDCAFSISETLSQTI